MDNGERYRQIVGDQTENSDPIWDTIRDEVGEEVSKELILGNFLDTAVLGRTSLEDSLAYLLSDKLATTTLNAERLHGLIYEALTSGASVHRAIREDISAVCSRDPACRGFFSILLYYKGYHALQSYRVAHYYWEQGRQTLAQYLQSRTSEVFGVDIHPAARIGCGILIDHATSVVIGETAVVEDNVSMLHEVTLGGTGKERGDRHPKIRTGVLISAGAKILGNVEVGEGAKIGGGAVVLEDVAPHTTVVGVPARVVGHPIHEQPALEMNHQIKENGDAG